MVNAYDFMNGVLFISTKDVSYNLIMRKHIVQVGYNSGSGKTLLVNMIKSYRDNNKYNEDCVDDSVFSFEDGVSIQELKKINGALIAIDRAELVLPKETIEYIRSDKNNDYNLF